MLEKINVRYPFLDISDALEIMPFALLTSVTELMSGGTANRGGACYYIQEQDRQEDRPMIDIRL